jgi:predicted outer membrane repeat protein
MKNPFMLATISCLLLAASTLYTQNIYVDINATGTDDGTDWINAYVDLQDALTNAVAGDTIRVAQGTYKPTDIADRDTSFIIPDSVVVLGGYDAGNGTRDIQVNTTILSGDIGVADDSTDNSYHVVYTYNVSEATLVDGFTISDGNAGGGTVDNLGGGWYIHGSGGGNTCNPTISNCTLTVNNALFSGGAMYITNGNPDITYCTFIENSAIDGSGGAIININSNPDITYCTFNSNIADFQGGAIFSNVNSNSDITDCTFSGNTAERGGALYNSNSHPTITDCTFTGNTPNYGGAIYNSDSNPGITNCTFLDNKVNNNGGAMFNYNSNPVISDCTFSGNKANIYGGAMLNNNSNAIITNCTFSKDTAIIYGGAIYNGNCKPVFNHCSFNQNITDLRGGAMFNYVSNPDITNCTFSANICNDDGGAIFNDLGSSPTITNCSLIENTADYGGAVYNYNQSNPFFANCTFFGNTADLEGGAMYNNLNSDPVLANCILWGDSASSGGHEIVNTTGTSSTVTYSLIAGGHAGDGNLDEDPLFIDATNGDLHLLACSPAINAGVNDSIPAGITTDLDSNMRIYEITVDMGAYEYTDSVCCNLVNTTANQGAGSLELTLDCTLPGDTVRFHPAMTNDTIKLTSSFLQIIENKILIADSLANITIDASQVIRAFEIDPGVTFEISGLRIISGTANEGAAFNVSGYLIMRKGVVEPNLVPGSGPKISGSGTILLDEDVLVN